MNENRIAPHRFEVYSRAMSLVACLIGFAVLDYLAASYMLFSEQLTVSDLFSGTAPLSWDFYRNISRIAGFLLCGLLYLKLSALLHGVRPRYFKGICLLGAIELLILLLFILPCSVGLLTVRIGDAVLSGRLSGLSPALLLVFLPPLSIMLFAFALYLLSGFALAPTLLLCSGCSIAESLVRSAQLMKGKRAPLFLFCIKQLPKLLLFPCFAGSLATAAAEFSHSCINRKERFILRRRV